MSTRECADENALARIECEKLVNDPNAKRYVSFKEFMDEMEQEEDNEQKTH
ncbi:MAG: hypothetical protein HDT44_01845 [Ruminococcaceae bacterium]|nr:hypothetical protein [Oscillospiraceae bacterium]